MNLAPSEMFKILGVETRVKIIELLKSRGPIGVKNIAEVLGVTPAAVSQHLRVLRQAGLVRNQREGYWIPYSIDEEALEGCRCILNKVCTCGCKGAGRFEQQEVSSADLTSLVKYQEELEEELESVLGRISEIKRQES
ncbi:metalloregulator ArsR/SmtB family transcription factor [Dehalococcoidia bacterium]|nr:metalloregulator ArsR/SmtB family transcription factor [Dehalococcoidia bacterium]